MSLSWTGWVDDPTAVTGTSPYVDWQRVVWGGWEKDGLSLGELPMPKLAEEISGDSHRRAPLPPFARPGPDATILDDPLIRLTWMPDADCAVVGVIDSALALAHERFRRLDGGTRYLCAWLMGGKWRDEAAVPFGRELFRTEIDQLMFRASVGGGVDEGEFDRLASATQYFDPRGDRRLDNRATHGTFVADLAAGYDPSDSHGDEYRRRLPIIGVGLPPRTSMGSSGNFLEFFALHAIEYIIDRADRIWRACDLPKGGAFPLVINLSYGLQAGPKDGQMLIEKVIRKANEEAEKRNRPIRVILPAGNDMQKEGCAKFTFGDGDSDRIGWQLQPEDHTPNFAELWSGPLDGSGGDDPAHPIGLDLHPPGGPSSGGAPGVAGQINTLKDGDREVARIYCRRHEGANGTHRMVYVICTRPTLEEDRMGGAPAGYWHWHLSAENAAEAFGYCQSDQTLTFGSETGYLSNFVHPDYRRFNDAGMLNDIVDYETGEDTDDTPPMRRRGTLNTIAALAEARVIGGYRVSDGEPAIYSNAASDDAVPDGRKAPTCLLPSDEGPARFGQLAAGSKSGSAALMSGTSFATALATRAVSQAMLGWINNGAVGDAPGTEDWFAQRVANDEASAGWPHGTVPEKAGFGRMDGPETGRPPRGWPG